MAKLKQKPVIPSIVKKVGLVGPYLRGEFRITKEPDEENPKQNVTRLRVKESYNSLKMITDYQKKLALRYALLVERAEGATQDIIAGVNLCSAGRESWEPKDGQLIAHEELSKIKTSVGKYHMDILQLVILKNLDCKQVAEYKGFNQYYAAGVVMSAFIKLEEAFDEVDNVTTR